MKKIILLFTLLFTMAGFVSAQSKKTKSPAKNQYPESFVIQRADFDRLFLYQPGEKIAISTNVYLDKSVMELNTRTGDMQLLRIKPAYFGKCLLMVQVNGQQSIQVFITSTDKKTFYRGKVDKEKVSMTRCKEEDIVTE